MSGPRKPRDLDEFMSVKASADWLRRLADQVERNESATTVLSLSIKIRRWDSEWEKRLNQPPARRTP